MIVLVMFGKKLFLSVALITVFLLSNQYMIATPSLATSDQVKHDTVNRTIEVTIVNATIYDDRASVINTPGHIFFVLKIENETYQTTPVDVNAPPAYTMNVSWTVSQNITLLPITLIIEVWDQAGGLDANTDFLGNFTITSRKLLQHK